MAPNFVQFNFRNLSFIGKDLTGESFCDDDIRGANFTNAISLILSCILGLTAGSELSPLSSIQISVQAAELSSQGSQDGVIKACTGQSINLGAPQLTEADLKVLTGCSSGVIPQLLEALKSRDWKVKVIAAHTLGLFGKQAQSVIPELSGLMQDENADVRFAVAQALGDIGTEAVVPVLAKALQDRDENVRVSAADAFLKIGAVAKPAKPVLIAALWDGNWYVRSKVASTLFLLGLDANDIPELAKDEIRTESLVSLFPKIYSPILNKPQDAPLFFIAESQHKDSKIRESVVMVLGEISVTRSGFVHLEQITNTLTKLMQDQDLKVRWRATQALGKVIHGFIGKDLLISFEKKRLRTEWGSFPDSDEIIRIELALGNAVKDPDPTVRQAAIESLGRLGVFKSNSQNIILMLLTTLKDPDPNVRQSAVKSLSRILSVISSRPNKAALAGLITSSLIKALSDENTNVRNEAINSLDYQILFPILIEVLERGKVGYEARQSFISVLWSKKSDYGKSEKAINLLSKFLQDPSFGIRQQAAIALNKIGKFDSKSATLIFLEGLSSKEPLIRLDSIQGINQICSKNLKPFLEVIGNCPEVKPMLPILIDILKNDIKPLQYSAAFAIAKIDSSQEDGIKFFQEILLTIDNYEYSELRANAVAVLHGMKSKKAKLALVESSSFNDRFRRYRLFDAEEVKTIWLDLHNPDEVNLLLKALENDNTRFMASKTFSSDYIYRDISDIILRDIISRLSQLLREQRNHYKDFSALESVFELKNQDLRRSVVYTLGELGMILKKSRPESGMDQKIVNILLNIFNDKTEDIDIQWMAATSLQKLGINNDTFFLQNHLLNPKNYQCLFPHRGRGITGFSFDRYSNQCVYNSTVGYGGGLSEIFNALRSLFSGQKK